MNTKQIEIICSGYRDKVHNHLIMPNEIIKDIEKQFDFDVYIKIIKELDKTIVFSHDVLKKYLKK